MPKTAKPARPRGRSSTAKKQVQELVESLPDDCSIEDVQYRLYVMQTIRRRLDLIERGEFISQEEVEKRVREWLTK